MSNIQISQHTLIIYKLSTNEEFYSKFTATQIARVILLMLNHYSPEVPWRLNGADSLLAKIAPNVEEQLLRRIKAKAKEYGLTL